MKNKVKADARIHTHVCTDNCKSGLGALGHKIPTHRLSAALEHMRIIYQECGQELNTGEAMTVIGRAASYLEEDEPYKALDMLYGEAECGHNIEPVKTLLDLTGAYRIMSVLLAG